MSVSKGLIGTVTIEQGTVLYLSMPKDPENRERVMKVKTTRTFEAKIGVHPVIYETVYHPVEAPAATFFNEHFDPGTYPQIMVMSSRLGGIK